MGFVTLLILSIYQQLEWFAVNCLDGGEFPIFNFEDEYSSLRMQDDRVRTKLLRSDRDIVPDSVIIF